MDTVKLISIIIDYIYESVIQLRNIRKCKLRFGNN